MKDEELRLELVKLVHSHSLEHHRVAERAKALADFIRTGEIKIPENWSVKVRPDKSA